MTCDGFDILHFANACWEDIFEKINGAAVYIDHGATECLHWFKGDKAYLKLIEAGAHSVHELSLFNFKYVKVSGTRTSVMILTSFDPQFYNKTLKTVIQKNLFTSCTIFCAVHHSILKIKNDVQNDDENVYQQRDEVSKINSYQLLERNIISWMDETEINQDPKVEIIFRPIFSAPISRSAFVAPPIDKLMPEIIGHPHSLSEEFSNNTEYFVRCLHSLFTHFNVKEDIYYLGKFSKQVANELENLEPAIQRRQRLSGVSSGVSLILIDRTLDLSTATKNNTECLLSRVITCLNHLPGHKNDVAINMTPLCPDLQESPLSLTVPGCLATEIREDFEMLINKNQKDVLLTLNKWLVEMLTTDMTSPRARLSTRVTAHSLEKMVNKVRDCERIEKLVTYSKKIQIILAIIQALKSERTQQLEMIISLEKLILQNLAASRDSSIILSQLSSIIRSRSTRNLKMEDLFILLIHLYSLAGDEIRFPEQQENQLKSALEAAFLEDIQKLNEINFDQEVSQYQQTLQLLCLLQHSEAQQSAKIIVNRLIQILHKVSEQRSNLHNFRSVISKPSIQEPAELIGVLEKLLKLILDPSRPEIADLKRTQSNPVATSWKKSDENQHPADNLWIIVYILGGITPEEIKIVNNLNSNGKSSIRITLGGCQLLNSADISDFLLLSELQNF